MSKPFYTVTFEANPSPSAGILPLGQVVIKTATGYVASTDAVRTSESARSSAIIVAQGKYPNQLILASEGVIPFDIANVGTGTTGEELVFVNSTGYLERMPVYDETRDIIGIAYDDGTVKVDFANLAFNPTVYANIGGGGGGGGGSTATVQQWTPTAQPTIKRYETHGTLVNTTIGPVPVPGVWTAIPAFADDGMYLCKVKVIAQRLSDVADNATFLVERGFRMVFGGLGTSTNAEEYSATSSFGGSSWSVLLDWDGGANRPHMLVQGINGRAIRWTVEYEVFFEKDQTGTSPPQIYTVEPATGNIIGGDSVAVTGEFLSTTSLVEFDGIPAASFLGATETIALVTTPAHAAGAVDVTITTANGSATKIGGYTYASVFNPALINLSAFFEPDLYNTTTYEWPGKVSAGTSVGLTAAKWGGWVGAPVHFTTAGGNTAPKINITNPAQVQGWTLGSGIVTGANNGTIVTRFSVDSFADWHAAADSGYWMDQPSGVRWRIPSAVAGSFDIEIKCGAGPAISIAGITYGFHTLSIKYDFGVSDLRARLDGGAWSSVVFAGPAVLNNSWWGFNPAGGEGTATKWVCFYASPLTLSDSDISNFENRSLTL